MDIDNFIIKGSKWFTANYGEVVEVFKLVYKDYDKFLEKSKILMEENKEKFSIQKMVDVLKSYLEPFTIKPEQTKLILPKLNKIELPKKELTNG